MYSKVRGLGLGLSLSKSLVEGLGGKLIVESQKGMGTKTEVQLPCIDSEADALEDLCVEDPQPRDAKITNSASSPTLASTLSPTPSRKDDEVFALIVDDNEVNLKVLVRLMSRMYFNCTVARSGEEAIEVVRANPHIDIILVSLEVIILCLLIECRWTSSCLELVA